MSFLWRVLQRLKRPSNFVGHDLEGNKFFEFPSTTEDPRRTRRRIEYKAYDDIQHYLSGSRRLPVQWVAWLSHTRPDAPTLDELRADQERQRRVLHNAAILQARDLEERARVKAASMPQVHAVPEPSAEEVQNPSQPSTTAHDHDHGPSADGRVHRGSELPTAGRDKNWQPEAWSPQAARKRGD